MKLVIDSGKGSAGVAYGSVSSLQRAQWSAACLQRLAELRPASSLAVLQSLAAEMADSLAYFDPVIAAEMEVEGGMLDD